MGYKKKCTLHTIAGEWVKEQLGYGAAQVTVWYWNP